MTPILVGFTGFGGAGKTTAMEFLQGQGLGRRVYLGQAVLDEIDRRGIPRSPRAEEVVRIELRSQHGPGAFADLRSPAIAQMISDGKCALIDAIFNPEEYTTLQSCGQERSVLVAIEASFETRLSRLIARADRPYSREELLKRDQIEKVELRTLAVLQMADFTISNESNIEDFHLNLLKFWRNLGN